jgi:hypothetical protein
VRVKLVQADIPRDLWSYDDYVAYLEGWSHVRLGTPLPPQDAHGPGARGGVLAILAAMPDGVRAGAIREALETITAGQRRGLFFDMGHGDALRASEAS